MYKHSTQQQRRNQIETLYNAGITKGVDICQRTSIPKQTVYRVLNLIKDKKNLQHRKGAGWPSKIKANDKRRIAALYQSNPRTFLRSILPRLSSSASISILHAQVKRKNFVSKRAVRVPALNDLHVSKRIAWCKEMKSFDWSKPSLLMNVQFDLTLEESTCGLKRDKRFICQPSGIHLKFIFGVEFQ
ncbi:hypothetical protein LOD99_15114 [Oopsacas minuta]|uniref:Resolvase HTH domain-containing protein n=1 Tax=Oopsacas minuta TaxID=111878 RepID=A0AAV7KFE5_9METZ|nr:hypothetical protein LOD99_15114 [Oopsacas minuta]